MSSQIDAAAPGDTSPVLLVFCNTPDIACAEKIANVLVERRLAACVNVLMPCQSVYRWQGSVERAQEIPIVVKTTSTCYAEVEATIRALHPYDVPEILALSASGGYPAYLGWVHAETLKNVT